MLMSKKLIFHQLSGSHRHFKIQRPFVQSSERRSWRKMEMDFHIYLLHSYSRFCEKFTSRATCKHWTSLSRAITHPSGPTYVASFLLRNPVLQPRSRILLPFGIFKSDMKASPCSFCEGAIFVFTRDVQLVGGHLQRAILNCAASVL